MMITFPWNLRSYLFVQCLCLVLIRANAQEDMEDIVFGKHRIVDSEILDQERLLYVHLPRDYDKSTEVYPVVYQLYSHFKENYYLPAIRTTSLMQQLGQAPGIIVVGIKNQEFRYRDLLPVDHHSAKSETDNFLEFFESELIPFIDDNYRTNGYTILSGPQAGAAFGIHCLARRPDLFNAFILTSPFWIKKARETLLSSIRQGLETNQYRNKFVMISYQDYLGEDEMKYLDSLSMLLGGNPLFEYVLNPIEPYTDFVAPLDFKKGMKTLFRDYEFPGTEDPKNLEFIERYYEELSLSLGFAIKIPEHGLVKEGDKFMRQDKLEQAKEIFLKMEELYPQSLMAFDRLGTVAIKENKYDTAVHYYEKFLKVQPQNPYARARIDEIKAAKNN